MTVRSERLGVGTMAVAGTGVLVYTCPADAQTIVKGISGVNIGAAADTAYWYVRSGGLDYAVLDATLAPPRTIYLPIWQVLEAGDELYVNSFGLSIFRTYVSGAQLAL